MGGDVLGHAPGLAAAGVLTGVFHKGLLHWRIVPCAPFVLA